MKPTCALSDDDARKALCELVERFKPQLARLLFEVLDSDEFHGLLSDLEELYARSSDE